MESDEPKELLYALDEYAKIHGIDPYSLVGGTDLPAFEKYDPYVPAELLRKAYAEDRLCTDEVITRLDMMARETE
jgi:hypothetical protein